MSKKPDHSENIIRELVETEVTFSSNINDCLVKLIQPLLKKVEANELKLSDPAMVEMFTEFAEICGQSALFLGYLKGSLQDIVYSFTTIPLIIRNCGGYIKAFRRFSPVLRKERLTNSAFNNFCEKQEENMCDNLGSILIQPIQRPPRYRLLLRELIKHTPVSEEKSSQYMHLTRLMDQVCLAIQEIDDQIGEFEEFIAKEELQTKMWDFEVRKEGRRLFFYGPVVKFSRKRMDDRFIAVFSDLLLVAEPSGLGRMYRVNKIYPSGEYNILSVDDHHPFINAVDVRQQKKSFRMNFDKPRGKSALLEGFEKMLDVCGLSAQTLEMKGFAPVWIPDDQAPNCMNCQSKFSVANRRHHCRYCGDCVCTNCFKNRIVCPGLGDEEQSVCPKCFVDVSMKWRNMEAQKAE